MLHWDFTNAKGKVQDDRSWEMEEKAAEPIIKIILKIISILNNVSKKMKIRYFSKDSEADLLGCICTN